MILIPFLISIITGYITITFLLKKNHLICLGLRLNLSIGLGMGLSALFCFYLLWIFNQASALMLIITHILYISLLCFINRKDIAYLFHIDKIGALSKNLIHPVAWIKYVLWIVIIGLIIFFAKAHAFGEWDAWALYNMKMRFFIFDHFKEVFQELHWHTQPDYPVLLPMINTWIYKLSHASTNLIPMSTGIIYTFLCSVLIYQGLSQFINKCVAFLPSLILFCNPFFTFLGTAQYADILLSYYLASVMITLICAIHHKNNPCIFLCGLLMGLLSFVKNEGIVMSIILIAVTGTFLLITKTLSKQEKMSLFLYLISGFALTASTTVLFKLFLAPTNKDVSTNFSIMTMQYFNLDGLKLISSALIKEFTHERWGYLWIFAIALTLLGIPRMFSKELLIPTGFFMVYGLILVYIYLTTANFDLEWRLKHTLGRICFYLLPSIFFYLFYMHFRKTKQ